MKRRFGGFGTKRSTLSQSNHKSCWLEDLVNKTGPRTVENGNELRPLHQSMGTGPRFTLVFRVLTLHIEVRPVAEQILASTGNGHDVDIGLLSQIRPSSSLLIADPSGPPCGSTPTRPRDCDENSTSSWYTSTSSLNGSNTGLIGSSAQTANPGCHKQPRNKPRCSSSTVHDSTFFNDSNIGAWPAHFQIVSSTT